MLHTKITSSSSSNSTFAFDTSYSIPTNNSQEKIHSNICLHEKNSNRNANDINQENKFLNRLVQSSIDITTNNFYSSINRENSHQNNEAIRIESALMASDCSHSLLHVSLPITGINMNRTIDLIKRSGAGDEDRSSHIYDKQEQTPPTMTSDNNQYLTLEQMPIHNRRKIQFTSKQLLILISISVFLFVILLSLTTIFLIF
jgi:hypothetical protein